MEMENEATPSKKGMSPMMIGGIVILVVVVIGAIVFMTKNGSRTSSETSNAPTAAPTQATQQVPAEGSAIEEKKEGTVKTFTIEGSSFKFSPNTITVNEGDMVKIIFKNVQGFHDFVLDEFNVKSKTIPANQTDEVQFVASKKGTFEFYCSVGNHRAMGMVGKLTVQ